LNVFGLGLSLTVFLLWMAKYGFDETQYDHYVIQMPGGVAGLNVESPVKFRGLEIGVVDNIQIDHINSEYINVSISIEKNTPIKEDNVAVLTPQGITGLSYIEIKGGTHQAARLAQGGTIKAGLSLFDKLEQTISSVSEKLIKTSDHVDQLLSQQNIQSIEQILVNFEQSSQHLNTQLQSFLSDKNSQALTALLENSANITQVFVQNGATIEKLLNQGVQLENQTSQTLTSIANTSQSINHTIATLQKKFDSGEYDIRQMSEPHLESFSNLLKELEVLSIQAGEVLQQIKESPSDLIFKQQQYQRGPGE